MSASRPSVALRALPLEGAIQVGEWAAHTDTRDGEGDDLPGPGLRDLIDARASAREVSQQHTAIVGHPEYSSRTTARIIQCPPHPHSPVLPGVASAGEAAGEPPYARIGPRRSVTAGHGTPRRAPASLAVQQFAGSTPASFLRLERQERYNDTTDESPRASPPQLSRLADACARGRALRQALPFALNHPAAVTQLYLAATHLAKETEAVLDAHGGGVGPTSAIVITLQAYRLAGLALRLEPAHSAPRSPGRSGPRLQPALPHQKQGEH